MYFVFDTEREWHRKIPLGCAPESDCPVVRRIFWEDSRAMALREGGRNGESAGLPLLGGLEDPHTQKHTPVGKGPAWIFVHRHEPAEGPAKSNRRQPSTYARACQYTTPSSGREKRQKVDQDL